MLTTRGKETKWIRQSKELTQETGQTQIQIETIRQRLRHNDI